MSRRANCQDCAFHVTGTCRRRPPLVFLLPDEHGTPLPTSVWPPVLPDDWCGDWRRPIASERPGLGPQPEGRYP